MSLREELETWEKGLQAYDAQDFEKSLADFELIADQSKILFNIGLIHATIGNHEAAVENFQAATGLDQYLAVAYFQQGVSNFLLGRYEEARRDFEEAFLYLRSNQIVDYNQLGLKFRLYSCEVLFNKGITLIYMGREEEGMADLAEARAEKQTPEHGVIDEAFGDRGDGYTVFSIPVGILFRPPENKVKNMKQKNYLGQAKLVAASRQSDAFTGFTGAQLASKKLPSPTILDEPRELPPPLPKPAAQLQRSNTTAPPVADAAPRPPAAPQRSNTVGPTPTATPGPPLTRADTESRYVDDLIGDYADYPPVPPMPQGQPKDRVADWAAQNARGAPPPRTSTPETARRGKSGKSYGGGGSGDFRRTPSSRARYDYEDEGFDELASREVRKIRIKLQYTGDTRAMNISPAMTLDEFIERLRAKFDLDISPLIKFKDEDGTWVSIKDEDDWESAIDEARNAAKGREEGKLEVSVVD